MKASEVAKVSVGIAVFVLVAFTMLRGQGWWWKMTKRGRVVAALVGVAIIVGVGVWVKH